MLSVFTSLILDVTSGFCFLEEDTFTQILYEICLKRNLEVLGVMNKKTDGCENILSIRIMIHKEKIECEFYCQNEKNIK